MESRVDNQFERLLNNYTNIRYVVMENVLVQEKMKSFLKPRVCFMTNLYMCIYPQMQKSNLALLISF